MKKKMFVAMALAMVMIVTTLTGCRIRSSSYDNRILNSAEEVWENIGYSRVENPFETGEGMFDVKEIDGGYEVNSNGTKCIIMKGENFQRKYSPKNVKPLNTQEEEIFQKSKEKVIDYIEKSDILLGNKEELKSCIDEVAVRVATYEEDELVGAYFESKDNTIYVNEASTDQVCEWMFTHELIHALSYETHGKMEYTYMYTHFNEVMTDIITSSLEPELLEDELMISAYVPQYWLVYPLLNIFQEEAMKGYWYGWEKFFIDQKVNKEEMDFYVLVVANYGQENSEAYFNNLMLKWEAANK